MDNLTESDRNRMLSEVREQYRAALLNDINMFEQRLVSETEMLKLARVFEAEGDVENGEALWETAQRGIKFANKMLKQLRGYLADLDRSDRS